MQKIRLAAAALAACCFANLAHADWDAAFEAREEAKRKAAQQEEVRKKAATDKMMRDTNVKAYREMLGKDAVGKSDADVEKLYKQRMAAYQKQGAAAAAGNAAMERDLKRLDKDTRPERDAQMKAMTGKSVTELHNMSDKELDAYAKDMEKRFGVK